MGFCYGRRLAPYSMTCGRFGENVGERHGVVGSCGFLGDRLARKQLFLASLISSLLRLRPGLLRF